MAAPPQPPADWESGAAASVAGGRRQRRGEAALGFALTLVCVLWALDLPARIGWAVFGEQFLALVLALTLPLAFLVGARRRHAWRPASALDWALSALGAGVSLAVLVRYPALQPMLGFRPVEAVVLGVVLLALVLEAIRRTCGLALFAVILVFAAYCFVGRFVPGQLQGRVVAPDWFVVYMALDTNALIGTSLKIAAEIVLPFILMGKILEVGGGAAWFNELALVLAGRARGGAGKITILSSALFGTVSGSAVANTVSSGVVTIPMMVKAGFAPPRAAAIEAVSSTGGQLVPPVMGAAAFLMAENLQLAYRDIALAAIGPSILFYAALYFFVDLAAGRDRIRLVDPAAIPTARAVWRAGWYFPIPFAALVVFLFGFNMPAEEAALAASALLVAGGFLFGYRGRRLAPRDLPAILVGTGLAVIEVLVICAAAGLVIGALNLSGLAHGLTQYLNELAQHRLWLLLIVAAGVGLVLGMGMPTVAVYMLLAPLVGPSLTKGGLDPVAAHLFLFYFGMLSMVTPPVALASFAAASIARCDFWRTGWEGVRIGWIAYALPFVFVFQPSLVFRGDAATGAAELAAGLAGVFFGTAALVGFQGGPLDPARRLAFVAAAVLLFLPLDVLGQAWVFNVAGLALGAATMALGRKRVAGGSAPIDRR
jgi:TRAP transporter 4TM/12TM fusion protein